MPTYTDYTVDTEFVDHGDMLAGISIGVVCVQDGREFYGINADMPQQLVAKGWLGENVWPHLPKRAGVLDLSHPNVLTPAQMHDGLVAFFGETDGRSRRNRLWGWYAAFDLVVLARFAGGFLNLGQPIPQFIRDLRAKVEDVGLNRFDLPDDPIELHHPVADARWNVEVGRKVGLW